MGAGNAELTLSQADINDVSEIYAQMRRRHAKLVGANGETRHLPQTLYAFLHQLIADLEDGKSVTILQENAQLTTVEAAKLLGVSRQFLVNLLDQGQIPHFMVGTHRRVYARDLLAFKSRRDTARRAALNALTQAESEEGIYDKITPYDSASR